MSNTNKEILEKAFALGKKYEQECTGVCTLDQYILELYI